MVRYVAAAMLCHYAGKKVTADAIKSICEAAGAEFDSSEVAPFVEKIEEMGIEAAIAEGSAKMASAPAGGVAVGGGAPAGGAPSGAAAAAPAAEEKKEEPEEEEDEDMGFSLFD